MKRATYPVGIIVVDVVYCGNTPWMQIHIRAGRHIAHARPVISTLWGLN